MKNQKAIYTAILSAIGMLLLILDSKTAMDGAADGVNICIRTVIPSLFPFFFLTKTITSSSKFFSLKFLRPIGRLCKISPGSEIFLFLGWIGGYPVGAQIMESAVIQGSLDRKSAERMLGFCNNPGPAFIFGITGLLFDKPYIPWILWAILIISTIITGMILPGQSHYIPNKIELKKSNYMTDALKSMATVCGWIILFRIILNILNRWFLWLIPVTWQVMLTGILEISNGCLSLNIIEEPAMRFVLAATMLSMGGLCVGMQTVSVSPSLNHKIYFVGKIIQTAIVIPISQIMTHLLFQKPIDSKSVIIFCTCALINLIFLINNQYIAKKLTPKYTYDKPQTDLIS